MLVVLTSSGGGTVSLPGEIGGEIEGAGERITSGDNRECSGDSLGGSGTRLAKIEWKCGEVAYNGVPNRGGRVKGGRYCAPNNGELAYLLEK